MRRRIERHRSLPHSHRPVIQRSIVGQALVRDIGHQLAVLRDAMFGFAVTVPTIEASSPHFVKTSRTSCARGLSATSSIRSCDSDSMIS